MKTRSEIWRPVTEFPEHYSVSSFGRIRREKASHGTVSGRIVGRYTDKCRPYPYVVLHVGGKAHRRMVHVLVALAFLGPKPPGHIVNHLDCDILNSTPENLEWTTFSGNARHAMKLGRMPPTRGHVILTEEQVRELRELSAMNRYSNGRHRRGFFPPLMKKWNVCRSTLMKAINGSNWGHLE